MAYGLNRFCGLTRSSLARRELLPRGASPCLKIARFEKRLFHSSRYCAKNKGRGSDQGTQSGRTTEVKGLSKAKNSVKKHGDHPDLVAAMEAVSAMKHQAELARQHTGLRARSVAKGGGGGLAGEGSDTFSSKVAHQTHEVQRVLAQGYKGIEEQLLSRVRVQNKERFRNLALSISLGTIFVLAAFGEEIRSFFMKSTAEIATVTLEDESLKIQTKELATAVVQTILNDANVNTQAARFLKLAVETPETQKALLDLTLHVLEHPETLSQVVRLLSDAINVLHQDPKAAAQLGELLGSALQTEEVQSAVFLILERISADPGMQQVFSDLFVAVLANPEVATATNALFENAGSKAFESPLLLNQSREFVVEVVGDDRLQSKGGQALINSVSHAVRPSLYRVLGLGLCCFSAAALKVVLSPF